MKISYTILLQDNPDYDYDNYDEDIAPRTCQPHAEEELVWGAPSITLEGKERFECPADKWLEPMNEGVLTSQILTTGDLQVLSGFFFVSIYIYFLRKTKIID